MRLKEYTLGLEAVTFIRRQLEHKRTLSANLLRLPLETGRVTTFLPPGLPDERVAAFEEGGITLRVRSDGHSGDRRPRSEGVEAQEAFDRPVGRGQHTWRIEPVLTCEELEPRVSHLVWDFISLSPRHVILVEDWLAEAEDPWMKTHPGPVTFHGGEVYHFMDQTNVSAQSIQDTLRRARSLSSVGVLTVLPAERGVALRGQLSGEQLRMAAEKAVWIIVRAYDGEGDLLWTPS